ncbi:MAG: hypothetical protein KDC87_01895 [Planctomycetes bacterium]|nr:hypothetical protein [Planctomycetota bacterium]
MTASGPQWIWDRLHRLRGRFLEDVAAHCATDYWHDDRDLEAYDAVLAPRIGWKLEAVLVELATRGASLVGGTLLDWGCGTGIAARTCAGPLGATRVLLHDRSPRAMAFAAARSTAALPGVPITTVADPHSVDPDLLLVSHALGELSAVGLDALLAIAQRSAQIVWVEAGSRTIARRLSEVRDRLLRDPWTVQLPCPHQGPCGALQAGEEHWCHGFASPPPEVFQDPFWRAAAQQLGIDLRALPYHYLVMTRSPAPCIAPQRRLLGRADVRNKLARCYVCDHTGLHHETIHKSTQPQLYRQLKKQLPPWLVDLGAVPPADPDS